MSTRPTKPRTRRTAPARATTAGGERRPAPQQARGRQRFEAILDAAEQVIAEVGVAAMTTNAVAEHAGAGMGSLYHLFGNKDAIVEALALRYMARMEALTNYASHPELGRIPLARLADAIVDPLYEFLRRTPAYLPVFHAVNQPGAANAGCEELHATIVRNVEAIIAARVPRRGGAVRHAQASVCVELVHSLLSAAIQAPAAQRRALVDETKRLLALYAEMLERGDDPLSRLG